LNMSKRILFANLLLVMVLLLGAGCTGKGGEGNQNNYAEIASSTLFQAGQTLWEENFDEVNLDQVIVGEKIMVMGKANADGSILAEQIIIGGGEGMMSFVGQNQPPAEGDEQVIERANFTPPEGGERPDFNNLSDEERAQLRERMPAGGGGTRGAGGAGRGGNFSQGRASGEVIAKDAGSITLKLEAGGSKLIFFSSSVKVLKRKAETEQPAVPAENPSATATTSQS
jgi:hypothetical protein